MESLLLEILRTAPTTGIILVFLWYGQDKILKQTERISRRMDCFESSQHACQLDNAKVFAAKVDVCEMDKKLDDHETRITRLESRP